MNATGTNLLATSVFPTRIPEVTEAMTPDESASFAAWTATPQGHAVYAALATHIVSRLGIDRGRVVSVGEGEGLLASEIAERLPGAQVIGTDISAHSIEQARARHRASNLSFQALPADELSCLGQFDAVVCAFALHHFADPRGAIASMTRVLRPGGSLYVQDLRRDASLGMYYQTLDMYVGANLPMAALFRASVNAAYTREEVRQLLTTHEGKLEVGLVRWGEEACAVYRALEPMHQYSLGPTLGVVEGLWVEGLWTKPARTDLS